MRRFAAGGKRDGQCTADGPARAHGGGRDRRLHRALSLIHIYGLTLEEGTPMYKYKGSPFLPSDDEQADMYLYASRCV